MVSVLADVVLLALATAIANPASAQWGQRFTVAAGPAIGIDDMPPDIGVHFRASVAATPRPSTFNVIADGYLTWLAPGTKTFNSPLGSLEFRNQETQIGIGLSGLVTFAQRQSLSPYLLVGGVYRRTDATTRVVERDPAGQVVDQAAADLERNDLDILVGLGAALRWGSRRVLVEARAYGGTVVYLPLTLGLTF